MWSPFLRAIQGRHSGSWAELLGGNYQRLLRRNCPSVMYMLLYLKRTTNRDLPHSTWNSAQCYVPAWVGAGLGGGWIRGCVWLSPFTVRLNNTVKWLHPDKKWFWCKKEKQNKMGSARTDLGVHAPSTSMWSVSRLTQSGRRTARSQPAHFAVSPGTVGPGDDLSRPGAPPPTKRTQGPTQMEPQEHRNSPRVGGTTQAQAHIHTHAPQPHRLPLGDSRRLISDCGTRRGVGGVCPRGAGMCVQSPPSRDGPVAVLLRGGPA